MNSVSDNVFVQADNALEKLNSALIQLSATLAVSFHSKEDKNTLQTALKTSQVNFNILKEARKQMDGADWDKEILPRNWFAASGEEGWETFREVFNTTYETVTRALGYSDKVDLSGRFKRIPVIAAKETKEALPDSTDFRFGVVGVIAIAIAIIVWKLA